MTTKAIEAGARACYDKFNENLIGCCEPTWDELPEDFRHRLTDAFDAGVKAAIASGELVPASAGKPFDKIKAGLEEAVSMANRARGIRAAMLNAATKDGERA